MYCETCGQDRQVQEALDWVQSCNEAKAAFDQIVPGMPAWDVAEIVWQASGLLTVTEDHWNPGEWVVITIRSRWNPHRIPGYFFKHEVAEILEEMGDPKPIDG